MIFYPLILCYFYVLADFVFESLGGLVCCYRRSALESFGRRQYKKAAQID